VVKINGAGPDFHRRDLWDAIQTGNCPEWELGLQLFDEAFADKFVFDVLDASEGDMAGTETWRRILNVAERLQSPVAGSIRSQAPPTEPAPRLPLTSGRSPPARVAIWTIMMGVFGATAALAAAPRRTSMQGSFRGLARCRRGRVYISLQ
jgi:hypothetical protein